MKNRTLASLYFFIKSGKFKPKEVKMAEEAVTQKDFELFRQEIKSDMALFKQEIRSEMQLAKDNIVKEVTDILGKKLNMLIAVVIVFIAAYVSYFEWTHNSLNEINHQRAALKLEEAITETLNKELATIGVRVLSGIEREKATSKVRNKKGIKK